MSLIITCDKCNKRIRTISLVPLLYTGYMKIILVEDNEEKNVAHLCVDCYKETVNIKQLEEYYANNLEPLLITPIETLEFTVRTTNCLKWAEINTVSDLINVTEKYLEQIPNMGKRSVREVITVLAHHKLTLKPSEGKNDD